MKDAYEMSFIQGLATAASFVKKARGEDTIAKEIISEHGYTYKDLCNANVEQSDLIVLKPLFKKEIEAWVKTKTQRKDDL